MRDTYNTITITASTIGAGLVAQQYARTSLKEALKAFEAYCTNLIRESELPQGGFYRYREDAVWSIDSIALS